MPKRRLTLEEFVSRARAVHGDKYDYSLVEYRNSGTKVKIICNTCGAVFEQKPDDHFRGKGCPSCAGNKRMSTEEFIEKAKKVHGDKIDFSNVVYVNGKTKVLLHCNVCGYEWQALPTNILRGAGCPNCADNLRLGKDGFIARARKKHGDKYDYSLVKYVNNRTKVKIKCNICDFVFEQTPHAHLRGQGCPKCGGSLKLDNESFIAKARQIHGDRYDYSLVNYVNNRTKVRIICKTCGNVFEQSPDSHLRGSGCPKCALLVKSLKRRKSFEEFRAEAKKIHGNKYDYSLAEYINAKTKIKIICNQCGKIFETTPDSHINQRTGCPYCAGYGFNKDKPAILYYLKIFHNNRIYYKIGVTNRTIDTRFNPEDLQKIEVLETWKYDKGEDAYKQEQEILKWFSEYRYDGKEYILENGNTELFITDVLGLDGGYYDQKVARIY